MSPRPAEQPARASQQHPACVTERRKMNEGPRPTSVSSFRESGSSCEACARRPTGGRIFKPEQPSSAPRGTSATKAGRGAPALASFSSRESAGKPVARRQGLVSPMTFRPDDYRVGNSRSSRPAFIFQPPECGKTSSGRRLKPLRRIRRGRMSSAAPVLDPIPARGSEAEEGRRSSRLDSGYQSRAASHLHYRLARSSASLIRACQPLPVALNLAMVSGFNRSVSNTLASADGLGPRFLLGDVGNSDATGIGGSGIRDFRTTGFSAFGASAARNCLARLIDQSP